jgi:site-specific recombinase XerD
MPSEKILDEEPFQARLPVKMSQTSAVRVSESLIINNLGQIDTDLNGRVTALFINKSNSESTKKMYRSIVRQFIVFSGLRKAEQVRVEDVIAWRESMTAKELAAHTIATKLAVLSALFDYLRDYGILARNPAAAKLVPRPRKPLQSPKGKALSVKEVRYLLYSIHRDNPVDLRDFAIVYLLLRLGLRVSEAAALKISDLQVVDRQWVIDYRSKGGRRERQPLPLDVKKVIDDYLEADRINRAETKTGGENAYLFQADVERRHFSNSRPLSTRHLWHLVKTRAEKAGLGRLSPHDLRRTAITKAFQQNLPLTSILNMSKHKSVETLMIYNKGLDNLENNAVHQLTYEIDDPPEKLSNGFNGI